MRVVAIETCEFSAAGLIALAASQRRMVIKKIRLLMSRRHFYDCYSVVKPSTRAEIKIVLARLKNSRVTALMTIHAYVLRESGWQPCRVHDRKVSGIGHWNSSIAFGHM
jgi:hypothetical protein